MSTITETVYTIAQTTAGEFVITANGEPLTNGRNSTRYFASRSSARKALSRIRRGVTR